MVGPDASHWRARIDLGASEPDARRIRYNRFEKGTAPIPPEMVEAIIARYRVKGPVPPPPVISDGDRLILAIAAQTAAISELVAELRRVADGQAGQANALAQLATLALDIRGLPGFPSETPPQRGSGGRRSGTARR